jgi:hypothetical protein
MPDHQPDGRSLHFAGDIDELGRPLPMSVEALRARTAKWPVSAHTPENVADILARSRQMFVDGYYTYENFMDAVTRSLQAVEAALRVRYNADRRTTFAQLIERAKAEGHISDEAYEILHVGRRLRNIEIHATTMTVITPAMAAGMVETSHKLVAELFEAEG